MVAGSEHETTIPAQRGEGERPSSRESPAAKTSPIELQHAATLGAAGLALFTLFKAYAAAKFSLTTAAALLTTAPLNVLLGTMVSYSYEIFPLLFLAAVAWVWHHYRQNRVWIPAHWIALLIAFLALLVSPWPYLWPSTTAFLILLSLSAAARWLAARSGSQQAGRTRWLISPLLATRVWVAVFFVVAGGLVIVRTLTNVWLPVEVVVYQQGIDCNVKIGHVVRASDNKQFTTADAYGCRMAVGNVLNDQGDWTTLVRADDRGLLRLRSTDVRYRELCHLSGVQLKGERPLLFVILRQPYVSPNTSCQILTGNIRGADLDPGSLPS
jgi:hypothetical protein